MKKLMAIPLALVLVLGMIVALPVQTIQPISVLAQGTVQVTADDVQRGSMQTIKVKADAQGDIIGIITYPSGHKVFLQGTTDENGALDYSFRVGGNTKPGTANVDILASTDAGRASGSTTFDISPKGAFVPPTEEGQPTPEPVPLPEVENETTPEEPPIVIAPENDTTVVTPENDTDISIPVNDTSVVIPSNDTIVPDPTQNDTEVIVAPENETEIVTEENASQVPEVPDEVVEDINETSVIVEGNETEVAENVTVSEPLPEDLTPIVNDTTEGNVTDVVVAPPGNVTETEPEPSENVTETFPPGNVTEVPTEPVPPTELPAEPPFENVTQPENVTVVEPAENVTVTPPEGGGNVTVTEPAENITITEPTEEVPPAENVTVEAPTEGNVTVETPGSNVTVTQPEEEPAPAVNVTNPEEAIDLVENQTEVLDQAVESGNVDEIFKSMQESISALQAIASIVPEATEDEKDRAEQAVNNMNDRISDAFNEVSKGD